MEFLIKLIITIVLIAVIIALVPTGIGIALAYPSSLGKSLRMQQKNKPYKQVQQEGKKKCSF